ncbi:MAG: hypothetical protein ACO1SV_12260 [Fimbriimonas sp.]
MTHKLGGRPFGDDFFAVLYPDVEEALKACSHFATVNGRTVDGKVTAYPFGLYGDVQAIIRTYQTPEGCEPLDPSSVFGIYDNEPGLFAQLRGQALEILGVLEAANPNSGKPAWQSILAAVRAMEKALRAGETEKAQNLAKTIRHITKRALDDYGGADAGEDEEDDPRDVDPVMEGLSGNGAAGP